MSYQETSFTSRNVFWPLRPKIKITTRLDNSHVYVGLEKDVEHEYREKLEVLGQIRLVLSALMEYVVHVPEVPGEFHLINGSAIDAEALAHRDEMGWTEESCAEAMLA